MTLHDCQSHDSSYVGLLRERGLWMHMEAVLATQRKANSEPYGQVVPHKYHDGHQLAAPSQNSSQVTMEVAVAAATAVAARRTNAAPANCLTASVAAGAAMAGQKADSSMVHVETCDPWRRPVRLQDPQMQGQAIH